MTRATTAAEPAAKPPPRRLRRWIGRAFRALGVLLLVAIVAALLDGWRAFGKRATGERRARMTRSPQWDRKASAFANPQPLQNDLVGMLTGAGHTSPDTAPRSPLSVAPLDPARLATLPASGLRATWFGHSTVLIEIDGKRLLTDPLWSHRVGPVHGVGPTRWYPPPLPLDGLPPLDAVIVSHDHFDHLDLQTIVALAPRVPRFYVGLGIGAHLEYWGVPADKIVELDWWEEAQLGELTIVCTPARHASGRFLTDKDATLWAGYAIVGPQHRVFFSGDTGLFPAVKRIGESYGPFDLTMIEVGQYHGSWPDWHIGPEQAVEAHQLLRGKVLLPIHWGLLTLAYHGWTEPIERTLAAAQQKGAVVTTPLPGQPIEPSALPPSTIWWPKLPFETAAQAPIVSHDAH